MPKVSVCIPVYDPGVFLSLAIDSVLAQTMTDFELIIVDDASTQPVEEVVACYRDSRIRFDKNVRNLGLVGNWNRCIELAQGRFVAIFHQDDIMRPDNLKAKIELLDEHPCVGLVHSDIETIDVSGIITGGHWANQRSKNLIEPGWYCFEQLAIHGNFIACPSVVVRTECYRLLGGFDHRLPFTCDLEMWMRIAGRYDVGYLETPLVANRVHAEQETWRFSGAGQEIREVRKALEIALTERPVPVGVSPHLERSARSYLATWAYRMGRWKLRQCKWRSAFGYFQAGVNAALRALA